MSEHPINQLSKNKKKTEENSENLVNYKELKKSDLEKSDSQDYVKKFKKNFDKWFILKKKKEEKKSYKVFEEREIHFAHIGENLGDEESGKGDEFLRPVLILKKFNKKIFFGIPLTTSKKKSKFYYNFMLKEKFSNAMLSQARLFDVKRLKYKMGKMSPAEFLKLKEKFLHLFKDEEIFFTPAKCRRDP